MSQSKDVPRKQLFLYSLLAMPLAFAGMPLYVHAPDFYATEYNLSLSAMGMVLLLLRFIDAVQDPVIGFLSDKYASYRGRFMLVALTILGLAFAALFQTEMSQPLLWFGIMLFLATSAHSVVSINFNTLGGVWSRDAYQKTRITTYREALGIIGLLFAVTMPTLLSQYMSTGDAFNWVSLALFILVLLSLISFTKWYRTHRDLSVSKPKSRISYRKIWQATSSQTRQFFGIYALSMLASSIPAITVLFFIRDLLGVEELAGLFLFLYFISGAVGMAFWQKISKRTNKYYAWAASMLLAAIAVFFSYFLTEGDIYQYTAICVLAGVSFGADLALPPSILADHIQNNKNEKNAALQFGFFAFIAKGALALGSIIALPLLDFAGFQAGQPNSEEALHQLSVVYAVIPCLIKLTSAVWLIRKFSLISKGDTHHEVNHNILDVRSDAHA